MAFDGERLGMGVITPGLRAPVSVTVGLGVGG